MSDSPDPASQQVSRRPRELALSAAWNAGFAHDLLTSDGAPVEVIFPGQWSHGAGPDFANAMLMIDAKYCRGSVEIHTRSSDWYVHGHHVDPAYDEVVLHVVSVNDRPYTRTCGGRTVPVATFSIPDTALLAIDRRLPEIWNELGGTVCAAELASSQPEILRNVLHTLGDERLETRVSIFAAERSTQTANAVFLRRIFDALGYSENREGMRQLADSVIRYGILDSDLCAEPAEPTHELMGIMLGLAGFLPLSPRDAHAGGILPSDQYVLERAWARCGASFASDIIPATAWHLSRVRPANHPVYRILQGASLMASTGGIPAETYLEAMRDGESPLAWIQRVTRRTGHPGLGAGRATAMAASVLIPFALGEARERRDLALEDIAWRHWGELRHQEWTRPARRAINQVTGGITIRRLNERGHQGLLRLDADYCCPRRCYQCPIAREVVASRVR